MPLSWHPALNDLISMMASLYPTGDKALFVIRRTGLNPAEIDLTGPAKSLWLRIVEEANKQDLIQELLRIGKKDYPSVDFDALRRLLGEKKAAPAPDLVAWRGSSAEAAQLEKITGQQPTFLPVSFLEIGLLQARSVARVGTPQGFGTGFLIPENLLITNHHVLRTAAEAEQSRIWFNYQKSAQGADREALEFRLDPGKGFSTSPSEDGDDWTAVRVKGNPNEQWGALELTDLSVSVHDFVNIVQHPGGLPKQIALYHNVVVYADDSRVQYLTDTMPGSSGSPVFDSLWRVVALHHSGGWLVEPGTQNVFFRNEGISVRVLRKGLMEHGLLTGRKA